MEPLFRPSYRDNVSNNLINFLDLPIILYFRMIFVLNLGWAGMSHSQDLSTGSAERSIVGGASPRHLLGSYYFAGTFTILGQTTIIYGTALTYFGFEELKGELWIIYLFCLLSGFVGTSIG